jgi:cytochrome P450
MHIYLERDEVSIFMQSSRHMCYDPTTYTDPEKFNPEWFMGDSPELDPQRIVFGFGRRICPGNFLALASIRITAAMVLWSFDVYPDKKDVVPEFKPSAGAVR